MHELAVLARPRSNGIEAKIAELSPREQLQRDVLPELVRGLRLEAHALHDHTPIHVKDIKAVLSSLPDEALAVVVEKYTSILLLEKKYGSENARHIIRIFADSHFSPRKNRTAKYQLLSDSEENVVDALIKESNARILNKIGPYHHDGGFVERYARSQVVFDRSVAVQRNPDRVFIAAVARYNQKADEYTMPSDKQFYKAKMQWEKWKKQRNRRDIIEKYEFIVRGRGALAAHSMNVRWEELREAYHKLKQPVTSERRTVFLALVEATIRGTSYDLNQQQANKLKIFARNITIMCNPMPYSFKTAVFDYFIARSVLELHHTIDLNKVEKRAVKLSESQRKKNAVRGYE